MYTKIHMYHILYMKCTVLLVFSCVFMCFHVFSLYFQCRNMYFIYISHVYQNTHVPYIIHEMHSFASVFMCFHVFSCVFLCFHCVLTVFSLQKHVLLVHFTYIPKYTCTIYSKWNAQFC
jgi:hypothetical protein